MLRNELIDSFCELSFEDSTKYVQGMNFIAGILSYHLSPELAFSIFLKLMKDYDLESNYSPGLIGFKQKSDVLSKYMHKHLPKLTRFLVSKLLSLRLVQEDNMIFIEMFTLEIIMGLCGSILPFDHLVSQAIILIVIYYR